MWGDSLVSWVLERERFKCQIAEISSGRDFELWKKKKVLLKKKKKDVPKADGGSKMTENDDLC